MRSAPGQMATAPQLESDYCRIEMWSVAEWLSDGVPLESDYCRIEIDVSPDELTPEEKLESDYCRIEMTRMTLPCSAALG